MDNYQLLTKFANDLPQAEAIEVIVKPHHTSMKPRSGYSAYYPDAEFIGEMLRGAQSFIYFLEDYGYEITKKTKKGNFSLPNRDRK
jgi:hypothetical protein